MAVFLFLFLRSLAHLFLLLVPLHQLLLQPFLQLLLLSVLPPLSVYVLLLPFVFVPLLIFLVLPVFQLHPQLSFKLLALSLIISQQVLSSLLLLLFSYAPLLQQQPLLLPLLPLYAFTPILLFAFEVFPCFEDRHLQISTQIFTLPSTFQFLEFLTLPATESLSFQLIRFLLILSQSQQVIFQVLGHPI